MSRGPRANAHTHAVRHGRGMGKDGHAIRADTAAGAACISATVCYNPSIHIPGLLYSISGEPLTTEIFFRRIPLGVLGQPVHCLHQPSNLLTHVHLPHSGLDSDSVQIRIGCRYSSRISESIQTRFIFGPEPNTRTCACFIARTASLMPGIAAR